MLGAGDFHLNDTGPIDSGCADILERLAVGFSMLPALGHHLPVARQQIGEGSRPGAGVRVRGEGEVQARDVGELDPSGLVADPELSGDTGVSDFLRVELISSGDLPASSATAM